MYTINITSRRFIAETQLQQPTKQIKLETSFVLDIDVPNLSKLHSVSIQWCKDIATHANVLQIDLFIYCIPNQFK